jgi:hypothetical protein
MGYCGVNGVKGLLELVCAGGRKESSMYGIAGVNGAWNMNGYMAIGAL